MPLRPVDPPTRSVRYDVRAVPDPGLLSVLLAPFARRGLIPDWMRAELVGRTMQVEIIMSEVPARLLVGCEADLRRAMGVLHVDVTLPASSGSAPDHRQSEQQMGGA